MLLLIFLRWSTVYISYMYCVYVLSRNYEVYLYVKYIYLDSKVRS